MINQLRRHGNSRAKAAMLLAFARTTNQPTDAVRRLVLRARHLHRPPDRSVKK